MVGDESVKGEGRRLESTLLEETNLGRITLNAGSKWIIQSSCNEAVDQIANVGSETGRIIFVINP